MTLQCYLQDLEALTETFNTAKTGLMFKDGQIEQLEVRDGISVLAFMPLPCLPLRCTASELLDLRTRSHHRPAGGHRRL